MTKIRHPEQKKGHASILIDADVIRLRRLAFEGKLNVRQASQFYQVGVETIRRAVRGDTFAHLGMKDADELKQEAQSSLKRFLEMRKEEEARLARNEAIVKGIDDVGIGREGRDGDAGYED